MYMYKYMYMLQSIVNSTVKGQINLQVELQPWKTKQQNNFEGVGQTFQEISTAVRVSSVLFHTNNVVMP